MWFGKSPILKVPYKRKTVFHFCFPNLPVLLPAQEPSHNAALQDICGKYLPVNLITCILGLLPEKLGARQLHILNSFTPRGPWLSHT